MSAADSTYRTSAPWPGRWEQDAACAGLQPLHDHVIHGEDEEEREARYWKAAEVCRGCVVRPECDEWRRATPLAHRFGVIAGHVRLNHRVERNLLAPTPAAVA